MPAPAAWSPPRRPPYGGDAPGRKTPPRSAARRRCRSTAGPRACDNSLRRVGGPPRLLPSIDVVQSPAGRGPIEKQRALATVAGQRRGALELLAGLGAAAELRQEVAAHARQEVVPLERRLPDERVDEREPGRRPVGHRERDGAVELHDRRGGQQLVQGGDPRPVGLPGGTRPGVARRDGGLHRVRAATQRLGLVESGEAPPDEPPAPPAPVPGPPPDPPPRRAPP